MDNHRDKKIPMAVWGEGEVREDKQMIDCPKAHRIYIFRKLVVSIYHNKVWFYCERCLKIIEKKFIE